MDANTVYTNNSTKGVHMCPDKFLPACFCKHFVAVSRDYVSSHVLLNKCGQKDKTYLNILFYKSLLQYFKLYLKYGLIRLSH